MRKGSLFNGILPLREGNALILTGHRSVKALEISPHDLEKNAVKQDWKGV